MLAKVQCKVIKNKKSIIGTDIWLGLSSGTLIVALTTAKHLANGMVELGKASEEIFRGHSLPILRQKRPNT